MKFLKSSLFLSLLFSTSIFAGSSQSLRLSSIVRPDINIYFDKVDGFRVISNSYFKRSNKPFKKNPKAKLRSKPNQNYRVLEVSMN